MEESIPKVFISYSHDSPEHKQWVAELAARLRHDGIDVILDQWDLSLGDDITRFMEDGLGQSDRVILICTENYVRKADAGEGGVAYERMIVTAELVKNLGTQKFIPVIRQNSEKPSLPKFLGIRFYVNLSHNQDINAQYELLLRELHKQPALTKPPLGKNPFARQPSGAEIPEAEVTGLPLVKISTQEKDVISIYDMAQEIARQGDLIAWRKLVKDIRSRLTGSLQEWRVRKNLEWIRNEKEYPLILDEAVSLYAPLFAIALAGIQSGREKFRDQRSVIDELLNPHGWTRGGHTAVVNIPLGLVFVFQGLYGSACLDTDQIDQVIQLGLMRIPMWNSTDSIKLVQNPELIGWPDSLGGSCTAAWDFLYKAAERWPWLTHVFILEKDYRVSLSAYYMALHIIELADTIADGNADILTGNHLHLCVPVSFLYDSDEIPQLAYRLLLRNNPSKIWKALHVSDEDMSKWWPYWIKQTKRWLDNVYNRFYSRYSIVHENLLREVGQPT